MHLAYNETISEFTRFTNICKDINNNTRERYPKLNQYLNSENYWLKISRFTANSLRDQNLSTSEVESLNAHIKKPISKTKNHWMFIYIYMISSMYA